MDPEKEIEQLKKERDEYLAGWQRAKADLVNYKKEEKDRLKSFAEYVKEETIQDLLPLLDNLERAEKEMRQEHGGDQVIQGFLKIGKQIQDFFKAQGVREIAAEGKEFNPNFHEAVGEGEGEKPGMVAEVTQKGYMIQNKVIRPAKVIVVK